ncbi:MAG: nucleoside 2-deoxyribosyltransferase [Richelia sp. RM2_1_2]|nr:nucleoside 2-deoxyribosyltransferase [Richelia sp. RM2_1_2]
MKKLKLYLAGPEVFLPNVTEIKNKKLEICNDFGFIGLFPIDDKPLPTLQTKSQVGLYIYKHNQQLIKQANGVIANISPFRSVSIDPGTAWEIGYSDALNRALFAYTNNPLLFADRVNAQYSTNIINGLKYGNDNIQIEDFDLIDNLMIVGSIYDSTKSLIISDIERELGDLTLFEFAVIEAKKYFNAMEHID